MTQNTSCLASSKIFALYISLICTHYLNILLTSKSKISSWTSLCYWLTANLSLVTITKSTQLDASTSSGRVAAGSQPGALKTCIHSLFAVGSRGLQGFLFSMQMLNFTTEHFYQRISNLLISKNRDKYLQPKHMARNNRWVETNRRVNTR